MPTDQIYNIYRKYRDRITAWSGPSTHEQTALESRDAIREFLAETEPVFQEQRKQEYLDQYEPFFQGGYFTRENLGVRYDQGGAQGVEDWLKSQSQHYENVLSRYRVRQQGGPTPYGYLTDQGQIEYDLDKFIEDQRAAGLPDSYINRWLREAFTWDYQTGQIMGFDNQYIDSLTRRQPIQSFEQPTVQPEETGGMLMPEEFLQQSRTGLMPLGPQPYSDYDTFVASLKSLGATNIPTEEEFLKLRGETEPDVVDFLIEPPITIAKNFEELRDKYVQDSKILAQADPELFIESIRNKGRSDQTEYLLKEVFPEISNTEMSIVFQDIEIPDYKKYIEEQRSIIPESLLQSAREKLAIFDSEWRLDTTPLPEGQQQVYRFRNTRTGQVVELDRALTEQDRHIMAGLTEQEILAYETAAEYDRTLNQIEIYERRQENAKGVLGTLRQFVGSVEFGIAGIAQSLAGAADWIGIPFLSNVYQTAGESIAKSMTEEGISIGALPLSEYDKGDPQWWAGVVGNLLPSVAMFIIPAIGGYTTGARIGAGLAAGWRLGPVATEAVTLISGGVGGTLATRPLESLMEAGGTYQETQDSEAAWRVFLGNLGLSGVDAAQIAAEFAPKYSPVAVALKLMAVASEGGEEYYQEGLQQLARGESFWEWTPEREAATISGAIGGGIFAAGGTMFTLLQDTTSQLPPEISGKIITQADQLEAEGLSREEALYAAMENVAAESPETEQAILEALREQAQEVQGAEGLRINEGQVLPGEVEAVAGEAQGAVAQPEGQGQVVRRGAGEGGENIQQPAPEQPSGAEQLEPIKETIEVGFHIGDTLVSPSRFNELSAEDQQQIRQLAKDYSKAKILDPRTELGPDQIARMTEKQRKRITDGIAEGFKIENKVRRILQTEEETQRYAVESELKTLTGREAQLKRHISDIESIYPKKLASSRENAVKTDYQNSQNELTQVQNRIAELKTPQQPQPKAPARGEAEAIAAPKEKVTSARQDIVQRDRKLLELNPVDSQERRGWEEAQNQAREQNIPAKALRIATEITNRPRPLTDVETAGLVIRMAELKVEHSSLTSEIAEATDQADISLKGAELSRIESEFDVISSAIYASGSEKGRALNSQKLAIDDDFSLVSVKARAKAKKGKPLTEKESAKLKQLVDDLNAANDRVAELEGQLAKEKARKYSKSGSKKYSKMTAAEKKVEIDSTVEDIRQMLESGCYR